LKNDLEAVICFNLNTENVLSLFTVADQHQAMKLQQSCVQFIRQNAKALENEPEYAEIMREIETAV
jgi:hypothetical protein